MADYYTAASDPANDSDLDSSVIRAEWTALALGFTKVAGYTGNGGKILAINSGGTAQEAITTTGTGNGVRATSPTLVTPVLGLATATSINKITLTQPAAGATLTLTDGKTLAATHTLTLSGTDGTVMTFPSTSATIARTDAANTFTGVQAMTSPSITTSIVTPSTSFDVFNTTATTVNAFGAASVALNIGSASAAAAFPGGISIPTGKTLSGAGAINITGAITGGAISGTTITGSTGVRATGLLGSGSGEGAFLQYNAGIGYLVARNETGPTSIPLSISASTITFALVNQNNLVLNADGSSTFSGAVTIPGTLGVTGAFGCNTKAAQTAYASGGALAAYGAGANGFDSGANASALHAMVVSIRAALVANGIMS